MPAPSLSQLTRRALVKNISMLTDIGDIPYAIIRPVLLKIENPKQLQLLEEASPQLYGADEEIWISLIKRDIPNAESKLTYPKNPKTWWKTYGKLRTEYDAEVEDDAVMLRNAFAGIKSAKDKRQVQVMEGTPKIPKLDGMQFAHAAEYNRVKKPVKDVRPTSQVLRFTNGSKTKVLTGKGVMDKARREAQDMSRFRSQHVLATPTHKLNDLASRVAQAPKWKVDEIRNAPRPKPTDPTIPKPGMFVRPKRRVVESRDAQRGAGVMTMEDRERRLLALTNPKSLAKAAPVTPQSTTSTVLESSASPSSATVSKPSSTASAMTRSSAKRPAATGNTPSSISPTAPSPSAKSQDASTASHSSKISSAVLKSTSSTSRTPTTTPLSSASAGLKSKAEESPIQSIEVDESSSARNLAQTTQSPPRVHVPRLSGSPSVNVRPMKAKRPVDVFMPNKRKRVS
ncbi:MAG: hypothetical protein LQ344_002970 [Seirophora lacunosa]|nr:MAG: hypothetical protein LQ344_002970 [Seirophora lacunosa]